MKKTVRGVALPVLVVALVLACTVAAFALIWAAWPLLRISSTVALASILLLVVLSLWPDPPSK